MAGAAGGQDGEAVLVGLESDRDRSIESGSRRRVGLFSQARIEASRWWKHGLRLAGPQDGHEPFWRTISALSEVVHTRSQAGDGAEGAGGGCDIGCGRWLGVGPEQFRV